MELSELLIGIAEIAVALVGFTGVVVVFGSRREGTWHPGDRLRLEMTSSSLWAAFMLYSLRSSQPRIRMNLASHGDVDRIANDLGSRG